MFRRFAAAWATFWLGVIVAFVLWATVSFKAGLLAFALGLLLTVVLVVLAVRRGASTGRKFLNDLAEEGRRNRVAGATAPGYDPRKTTTVDDVTPADQPDRDQRFAGGPAQDPEAIWPPADGRDYRRW